MNLHRSERIVNPVGNLFLPEVNRDELSDKLRKTIFDDRLTDARHQSHLEVKHTEEEEEEETCAPLT